MDSKGFLRVQRQNRDSNGSIETKSLLQKLMVQGRFRLEKPLRIVILFARKLINRDSVCRNPSERDRVSRNPLESVLILFCRLLYERLFEAVPEVRTTQTTAFASLFTKFLVVPLTL